MNEIWEDKIKLPKFQKLNEDKKTDVLIVGGGIAGILSLYMLKNAGVDCMLTEQNEIVSGVTQNTTAKITVGHGLIYDKTINYYGTEKAYLYLTANKKALDIYRQMSKKIDCDFQNKDNYIYSKNDSKKIEREVEALNKLKYKADFCKNTLLPFEISGAIKYRNQAQFNPLKFISEIAKDLNIFENTKVTEIRGNVAFCEKHKITAKKIIVATHFPFINKKGAYFLKMYQDRSYVIALKNAPDFNGMYRDEQTTGLSFRNYKNYLLLGGGSHRTGKPGGNYTELRDFAKLNFPKAKEVYSFATQDCITLDGIPYIGHYSKATPDLFVITGFNKWGMTTSLAAASIITDLITKNESKYESVFSPSRSMLHLNLLINSFEAVTNILRFTKVRCPHLGCKLNWNPQERSYDCPCHGSRFAENGKLLNNPSTDDLKLR